MLILTENEVNRGTFLLKCGQQIQPVFQSINKSKHTVQQRGKNALKQCCLGVCILHIY